MIANTEKLIGALEELKKTLTADITDGKSPSDLTIARVVDLSRAGLPGDATNSVISRLQEKSNAQMALELTEAAIQSLETDASHALAQPESTPHLQSLVTHALFDSRWIKYSILGLIVAYAGAAAMLVIPIRDVFGKAGEVADSLVKVEQSVADANEQVETARGLVKNVNLRIGTALKEFRDLEGRIDVVRREVELIGDDIKSQKTKFEGDVSAIKETVKEVAKNARREIATAPSRTDMRVQEAFANAERLATERISVISVSIDSHKAQADILGASIAALGKNIAAHTETLEGAVNILKTQERTAADAFDEVPGRIDALFVGQDEIIDIRMGGLLTDLEKQGGETLSTVIDNLTKLLNHPTEKEKELIKQRTEFFEQRLGALKTFIDEFEPGLKQRTRDATELVTTWRVDSKDRLDVVGDRLTELENAALTLEQGRRRNEIKYGAIEIFADQVRNVETRLADSDKRIRALSDKISPAEELIAALSDRAAPVAQILSEALAVGNEEIADQLWQVVKTNYAIAVLAIACVIYFLWLLYLSFRRPRAKTGGAMAGPSASTGEASKIEVPESNIS